VDDSADRQLTLVVAPAGSGKTTLVADWARRSGSRTAWVTLADQESNGLRFWAAVTAALSVVVPGLDDASPAIPAPGTALDAMDNLLASLAGVLAPQPTVLVLDDLQRVDHDAETIRSLGSLVETLPSWLHLVVLSRRVPALPVARLRARRQMGEMHFAELKFSTAEADEMLAKLVPALSKEERRPIATGSAGWAAGLQMAALAARASQARSARSPLRDRELLLAEYVWDEVLAGEREDVVQVLVDTAVVGRVNGDLAGALADRTDAEALLEEADARGLFVSRIDPSGWFEVHALVREVLLAEAERRAPGRAADLHARAALWFEKSGDTPRALRHLLLVGQLRAALGLLARHVATLYDQGLADLISHTLTEIPQEVANQDLETRVEYTWCLLLVDRERFLNLVHELTMMVGAGEDVDETVCNRLLMLRSIAETITGDCVAGAALAEQALEGFGPGAPTDLIGRFGWNMVARGLALSERWDDWLPEVRRARLRLSSDPHRMLAFEGTRALGQALAGRPVEALRTAEAVRAGGQVQPLSILRAELDIAEAVAHRELGDRARAVAELLPLAEEPIGPVVYSQVIALCELTRARIDDGDLESAAHSFERLLEVVTGQFPGRDGRIWLARAGTLLAVAKGDAAQARGWSERVDDDFWFQINTVRLHLAEGDKARANELLGLARPTTPRKEVVWNLLTARATANPTAALKPVMHAVETATSVGLLQTVASEGEEVLDLLDRVAWLVPRGWLDRVRRAAAHRPAGPVSGLAPGSVLSEREMDVLRMLPTRLTIAEIAAELSISVNTVKFHLKVIYRKLGVSSRAEAASVTRAMTSLRRTVD
jgi:LuxR family maltose regulon positive regulatory protein